MLELPGDASKSYQDLFPEQFEAEELKSTLKAPERRVVWNHIEKCRQELTNLRGIVQNPMPISEDDLLQWTLSVNKLIDKLMKLDANVKKIVHDRI